MYTNRQIQLVLEQMKLFTKSYGAYYCSTKEDHLQHWIDLIQIQSKRSSLVNITLEKQPSLWNLGHEICPWLGSRSFTQILNSQLSPLEEYLSALDQKLKAKNTDHEEPQVKYRGRSRASHLCLSSDPPPADSLSTKCLKKLEGEYCHPGNPLYFTAYTSWHETPRVKTAEPSDSNHTLFPPKPSPSQLLGRD